MRITFNIDYQTRWGELVCLSGNAGFFADLSNDGVIELECTGPGKWGGTIDLHDNTGSFEYYYLVKSDGGIVRREWGAERRFTPSGKQVYRLFDSWQDMPLDKPYLSSAFTQVFLAHRVENTPDKPAEKPLLTIRVWAPETPADEIIAMVGDGDKLGNWNPAKARPLTPSPFPLWSITLEGPLAKKRPEYKLIRLKKGAPENAVWEEGLNRKLEIEAISKDEEIILSGLHFRNAPMCWRGAGVAIPVFSLRSLDSFGIGDFLDLKKLGDWAVATGQKVIQILPVNDTTLTHTWTDSYPYNANSTFALHPLYMNLYGLGRIKDEATLKRLETIRERLNERREIDYEEVSLVKWDYFKAIYEETGESILKSAGYKKFFNDNREWLIPYAAFCFLRDQYQTSDFSLWPEYSQYRKNDIEELCAPGNFHYREIALHYFLQYHLHLQLSDASGYIRKRGVVLKGDIPIGISRNSVDAWSESHLFNTASQAGAPPDAFSFAGQNWGFPTYNWNIMEQDGFCWWKKRLGKMAEYFDAYRIDHILGFFRIWEIPSDEISGLLGHFNPALPMAPDEIERYGFWFDESRIAEPYIRHYFLADLFGEDTDEVIHRYLDDRGNGMYGLKPDFRTQREIEASFKGKNDSRSQNIKSGLFRLTEEILFVRDPYQTNKFHPRISAQYSYSYKGLDPYQQGCYNRLYDDFFYHRHNEFWKHEAMKKLPALISATDMLVCAEDLGMIPHSVPEVMDRLRILSLEIQRMPKNPESQFADTYRYPYLSVCSTSTHDMAPIRAWWEEDRDTTQFFYNHILHESGEAPYFCEPWICERIVNLHLQSPSMLAILPLQDWLSIDGLIRRETPQDERINIPADPLHYWRYRMHMTLEELLAAETFNRHLYHLITQSGR